MRPTANLGGAGEPETRVKRFRSSWWYPQIPPDTCRIEQRNTVPRESSRVNGMDRIERTKKKMIRRTAGSGSRASYCRAKVVLCSDKPFACLQAAGSGRPGLVAFPIVVPALNVLPSAPCLVVRPWYLPHVPSSCLCLCLPGVDGILSWP